MSKFGLQTKDGENITLTNANSLEEAQEKFAVRKQLTIEQLLDIFNVEEIEEI